MAPKLTPPMPPPKATLRAFKLVGEWRSPATPGDLRRCCRVFRQMLECQGRWIAPARRPAAEVRPYARCAAGDAEESDGRARGKEGPHRGGRQPQQCGLGHRAKAGRGGGDLRLLLPATQGAPTFEGHRPA